MVYPCLSHDLQDFSHRGAGFLLISMDIADIASFLSMMTVSDNIHVFTFFWMGDAGRYKSLCHV